MPVNPYEASADFRPDVERSQRSVQHVAAFSLLLYLIAFFLPAFDSQTPQVMYGYHAFMFAIVSVRFVPTWMANPVYWLALRNAYRGNVGAVQGYAVASTLLAVCQVWMMDDAPQVGFYLWSFSMGLLGIGAILIRDSKKQIES